jgi:uncharacterized protein (DUF1499 family)
MFFWCWFQVAVLLFVLRTKCCCLSQQQYRSKRATNHEPTKWNELRVPQFRPLVETQQQQQQLTTRRRAFGNVFAILTSSITSAAMIESLKSYAYGETIGKDPACNDALCLGVWDGILADCPHPTTTIAGCVSSQDDTPATFAEPWDYSEELDFVATSKISDTGSDDVVMQRLVSAIQQVSNRRGDIVETILQDGRYLHVLFQDHQSQEFSNGEFYITPNDTTIQFRLCSSVGNTRSARRNLLLFATPLRNIDRAELIRKELHFLKLPILRNRQRSFLFLESDLDSFGPGSTALGPPEEMKLYDIENSY